MHIHVANPVITSNDQLSSEIFRNLTSFQLRLYYHLPGSFQGFFGWSPLQSERKGWSFGRVNIGGFEQFGLKATLNAFPT